jgi:pantetheine-phosphate adenylyltransferase
MKVCIGGTFDPLHKGHKSLIKKAFEIAGEKGYVFIGVTSGEMIKRKGDVRPFEDRKKALERFLSEEELTAEVTIGEIYDKYGPSIDGDFDAIVVSPETRESAVEINEKRKRLNKKPLDIVEIPFVLAEDKTIISSSRIKEKKIDENGNVLKEDLG